MTRIDFYISKDKHPGARQKLACKLIEKAYKLGHHIYVHTDSDQKASELDELLWTFRDGSFVPHHKLPATEDQNSPVLIGHANEPGGEHDVLINLADEVPNFFSRFERVAELVDDNPENKTRGRDRFRFYRDRGYELKTHELS
jgi:DNA polymerase-3 subunit chi